MTQVVISTSVDPAASSESITIASNELITSLLGQLDNTTVTRLNNIYKHDGVEAELLSTIVHEIFSIEVGAPIKSLRFMAKYKNVSITLTEKLLSEVVYFFKKRFIIDQLRFTGTQRLSMTAAPDTDPNQILEISIFSHLRGREICTADEFVDAFTYHKLMSDAADGSFSESQWPAALGLLNKYSSHRHRLVSLMTFDNVNNTTPGVSQHGRI